MYDAQNLINRTGDLQTCIQFLMFLIYRLTGACFVTPYIHSYLSVLS